MTAIVAAATALASCDDDKIYDKGHAEANLISEVTFDYMGEITLPVGFDMALNPKALPEEAAAEAGLIYKTTDASIAYIDDSGVLHCLKEGVANVSAVPEIGFGPTASLTVNVADHVVYAQSLNIKADPEIPEYIYEGDTFSLSVEILPADHTYDFVSWKSTDESVLAVSEDGTVTCGKPGTASIIVETRYPDKEGIKGELSLTVCEPVDVERIEIAALTESVCVSRPFDLDVTYYPAYGTRGSVTWESSDEKVAFVNRGHVTPTGFGTCTLTGTCKNGSQQSVTVTVTPGWYIWDGVNNFNPWIGGSNATVTLVDGVMNVKMSEMKAGGDWRGDIVLVNDANNPVPFQFSEYPVIALRTTIPANGRNTFDGVSADNVNAGNPQCNEGRFATGNPITLSDGTKLIYVDFKERNKYQEGGITEMKLLQLKVADIPAADVPGDKSYKIYWIRTFRSTDEMKAFAEQEISAGN